MTSRIAATLATGLALLAPVLAGAQSSYDEQQQLMAKIQTDKRAVVLDSLRLSDAEAAAFTDIYDDYQSEMKASFEAGNDLAHKYAANYDAMTDGAAKSILKDWFALRDSRNGLMEKYARKFAKVMPPQKVLRWVQIEHKLNTLFDAQTAAMIPLTQ